MRSIYIVVVFAIVAAVKADQPNVAVADDNTSRQVNWYDCRADGGEPGNRMHPWDCTRFITCDAGLNAWERDCPSCTNDPSRCTDTGRLVFSDRSDACLWADETECVVSSPTEGPIESPTTEGSEEPAPTTAAPQPTTAAPQPTTEAPEPEKPPQEGDHCDPMNCRNVGECQHYLRCDKAQKRWVKEVCGFQLFWNPENGSVHGGNCDLIDNLSDEVEERYRSDKNCLACFWEATGECEQQYHYQAPNNTNREVLLMSCSDSLIFSQDKETCQHCSDVYKSNGDACC